MDTRTASSRRGPRMPLLRGAVASAVAATVALVALPQTAFASAYGIAGWSTYNLNIGSQTISVPLGTLEHEIIGSGCKIVSEVGDAAAPQLCYPRIDFTSLQSGKLTARSAGPQVNRCVFNRFTRQRNNVTLPSVLRLQACAEYRSNVTVKATQCHAVYA